MIRATGRSSGRANGSGGAYITYSTIPCVRTARSAVASLWPSTYTTPHLAAMTLYCSAIPIISYRCVVSATPFGMVHVRSARSVLMDGRQICDR